MTYEGLMERRLDIARAQGHLRRTNQTIPDESISFIFNAAYADFKRLVRHACQFDEITQQQRKMLLMHL